jgi:hypothetical protein
LISDLARRQGEASDGIALALLAPEPGETDQLAMARWRAAARAAGRSWTAAARDLLAPIYGWFAEGFDTPVLKEAKALLNEL